MFVYSSLGKSRSWGIEPQINLRILNDCKVLHNELAVSLDLASKNFLLEWKERNK